MHDIVSSCVSFTSYFNVCKKLFIVNCPALQGSPKLLSNNYAVSVTKCIVDKIQTGSVDFGPIIGMKNVDPQPGWWPVLTACILTLHKCFQGLGSHIAAHADLSESKALGGSLDLINLSLRGLLCGGRTFR